jgi:hypothetical protein
MASPDDVNDKWMLIHQVTGTYLETDYYTCAPNEAVQTWHEDPPREVAGQKGHLWELIKQTDETYLIRSSQKNSTFGEKMYLEASADTEKQWNQAYPRLQRRSDSELQSWVLTQIANELDTYAIQPKRFPGYALGLQSNNCTTNVYVIANRTWGRPTFHHYWRRVKMNGTDCDFINPY